MAIYYTPTTNFGAKDSLPVNDPAKVIKGAEHTTEYTAIQSAFLLAAPASNPTFTGYAEFEDVDASGTLSVSGFSSLTNTGISGNLTVTGTIEGRDISADGAKLDTIDSNANNYVLPQASFASRGGVQLVTDVQQTTGAQAVTTDAGKTYAIQLNTANRMVVNVPWTDTVNPGTVTSVSGANGISGTVTTSGNLTLDSDLRSHVFQIGRDTNDYYIVNTTTHSWYLDGAEDMRLTNNGNLDVEGNVIAYSTTVSDARLKDNVETIDGALEKVERLRGVTFEWNKGSRQGQKDIGLIAQEVQEVLPELVIESKNSLIDGEDYLTVSYGQVVSVLIEAVKELSAEVKALKESK